MKLKISFLTILLSSILCAMQAMAAFTPGTYYLQTASGTYIDALPVNSSNPGAKFQSSSATAFTFTAVDGGYTIQNAADDNYLLYSTANNWDTKMSSSASETNYDGIWTVTEGSDGKISISRSYKGATYYLGNGNTNAGTGVYSGQTSAVWYTPLTEEPTDSKNVKVFHAKDYITNTSTNLDGSKKYTTVPAGKAWQISLDVIHEEGQTSSYNQYGSCILASTNDPVNTYYWNNFQLFEHTNAKGGTLNFKSNKADGNDHIIAQGHKVYTESGYENYRVIVRHDGKSIYLIRTVILDKDGKETGQVFNNVWVAARPQNEIDEMSTALPEGTEIKDLKISIAEESNLLEGVDYAIQNIESSYYLTDVPLNNSVYASDATKYQIEFTGNEDLTYAEQDGGLHHSFYIKNDQGNYLGSNNSFVENKNDATPFIYTTNQHIAPITAQNTLSSEWTIDSNNTWLWDFFANFYVEVAGNNNGGLKYIKGGEPKTATNGQYLELPSGVKVEQLANSSQPGYSASISKSDIRIKVQYKPLENTFYNFTDKSTNTTTLYYWYKPQSTLVTYSTTNSQSGERVEWEEKGDCSKFTITKAATIPVKMNLNAAGSNADNKYYGTIYCPNALALPEGVTAYRLNSISGDNYLLKPIDGNLLAASTPAVLISDAANADDPSGDWNIDASNTKTMSETNLFLGVFEDTANPGAEQQASSPIYVLGNHPVDNEINLGFYPYSAAMIPAFKAYHNTQRSKAPARFLFTFDEGNESNAIRNHKQTSASGNGIYYDLTGRAVVTPSRGHLYIYNGKKVIY